MKDYFDTAINTIVDEFENISTTEDTRKGNDRRRLNAKEFPLSDNNGKVVVQDRRTQTDRRNTMIDIDDISDLPFSENIFYDVITCEE